MHPDLGFRMGSRKVQNDPPHRSHDVDANRQQRLAQARDLRARERGAIGAPLELLQQDIGGGAQEHAQLIGPEARATGPTEGERVMQFFQPILAVAARAVHVRVHPLGGLTQIGDDKARIVTHLAAVVPHHFGLHHDAAGSRPRAGLIVGVVIARGRRARRRDLCPQRDDMPARRRPPGGIEPSRWTSNVFLFADSARGEQHGYIDAWQDDGCFHYTGEGQRGDQQMTHGNAAILRHVEQRRTLRLFEGAGGRSPTWATLPSTPLNRSTRRMRQKQAAAPCGRSSCFGCGPNRPCRTSRPATFHLHTEPA